MVENLVSAGSLARNSLVDIFAFAVPMLTAQAIHRSCTETTRPGCWAEAAKLLG